MLKDVSAAERSFRKGAWFAPSAPKTIHVRVTPAPSRTPATDGRLGTAANCVTGSVQRIATTVILWIFDNRHNLTNLCKCAIMSSIQSVHVCASLRTLVDMHLFYFSKEVIKMGRIPMRGEARDTRLVTLVTTNTYKNLEKVAAVQRTHMSAIVNDLIVEYVKNHQVDIDRYNAFFGEE